MLNLNNLASPKGSIRNTKRIGRGQGSGYGTQAGKGHKGQKARSGGGVRTGFEGGSMPLYMRLPKRGFKNAEFKTVYAVVSLEQIQAKFEEGAEVNRETLVGNGLLKGINKRLPIKILNSDNFDKKYTFSGIEKFSATAKEKIEKSGSTVK